MKDNEIKFIAEHYRKGLFSASEGWKRLGIAPVSWWRRYRVAAAVAATIIISASATVIYRHYNMSATKDSQPVEQISTAPAEAIRIIDFENTPLPVVIAEIKEVYDVTVSNVPDNAAEYHLSLHYEGNASDLVDTINEILNTEMTIEP